MLINIQFLRFVAAMLVVIYHSSAQLRATGVDQGLFFAVGEAVGFAGVDIFFVISGYIMTYTSNNAFGMKDGVGFIRRRVARIYSGYWPFYLLTLGFLIWTGGNQLTHTELFQSAILWPASQVVIGVSWTLTFEMYFYLIFTLLIFFSGSNRATLLKFLMLGIVVWSLFREFIQHAYAPGQLETINLASHYLLNPYMAEFFAGAVLANWLKHNPAGLSWFWLIVGSALFLAGGWVNNSLFDGKIEQGYYVVWRVMVFGTASFIIVLGLIRLEQRKITAPLKLSLMTGGASYAIYLSHSLWLSASQHFSFNQYLGQFSAHIVQLVFILYVLVILISSIVFYRQIERPLHYLFKKWLKV